MSKGKTGAPNNKLWSNPPQEAVGGRLILCGNPHVVISSNSGRAAALCCQQLSQWLKLLAEGSNHRACGPASCREQRLSTWSQKCSKTKPWELLVWAHAAGKSHVWPTLTWRVFKLNKWRLTKDTSVIYQHSFFYWETQSRMKPLDWLKYVIFTSGLSHPIFRRLSIFTSLHQNICALTLFSLDIIFSKKQFVQIMGKKKHQYSFCVRLTQKRNCNTAYFLCSIKRLLIHTTTTVNNIKQTQKSFKLLMWLIALYIYLSFL